MTEKYHELTLTLYGEADRSWWFDAIEDLCKCRRHWWQFWRSKECHFATLSARTGTDRQLHPEDYPLDSDDEKA